MIFSRSKENISYNEVYFTAINNVRNEIDPNHIRLLHDASEVKYTVNKDGTRGKPYMPRKFPLGRCKILSVERWAANRGDGKPNFSKADFGLVRIRTDAHQTVHVWALDDKGGYDHVTDETIEDYGYLIHNAVSTTLGCINCVSPTAMEKLAEMVEEDLKTAAQYLEVVE